MEINKTKLLVGCVTHEAKAYCQEEFITQTCNLDHPDYDFLIIDNSPKTSDNINEISRIRDRIWNHKENPKAQRMILDTDVWHYDSRARVMTSYNKVREHFLKGEYTHLLLIESDIFPKNSEFIQKWIKLNKSVMTAMYKLYTITRPPSKIGHLDWKWQYSVWYKRRILEEGVLYQKWIEKDAFEKGVRELDYTYNGFGTGLVMFQRDILFQLVFKNGYGTADSYIKKDLDMVGVKSWLDTDVQIEHKNEPWDDVIEKDIELVKKLKRCGKELKALKKTEKKIEDRNIEVKRQ